MTRRAERSQRPGSLKYDEYTQGIYSFSYVYYAQIEPDGQLTVICDKKQMPSVIIMKDGVPRKHELERYSRKGRPPYVTITTFSG